MLDYAANAIVYWPEGRVRAEFEARCELDGATGDEVLAEFLGQDADVEGFWQRARVNMEAGRVRLIFVAEEIPVELQRVIEFLNQQMRFAEVLAIEVKQYGGEDLKTLVSRTIGQTAAAAGAKGIASDGGERRDWNEELVFSVFQDPRSLLAPHIAGFIAYLGDRPASAAMVMVAYGVALVDWVGTIASARRRGLGRTVTERAVESGFDLGARLASLQASPVSPGAIASLWRTSPCRPRRRGAPRRSRPRAPQESPG